MTASPVKQQTIWKLDTNNTTVEFSVKKFMVTNVKGRFARFSGIITADEASPELSSVSVIAPLATRVTIARTQPESCGGAAAWLSCAGISPDGSPLPIGPRQAWRRSYSSRPWRRARAAAS